MSSALSSSSIGLPAAPVTQLEAATKQYVDNADAAKVSKTGDTLTGPLVLAGDPTVDLQAATKQYVDSRASNAAGNIEFTPAGAVAATNVQTAIQELDTEKLALDGGVMAGALILVDKPAAEYGDLESVPKQYVDKYGTQEYVFPSASFSWVINHTLDRRPNVIILDASGNQVLADVVFDLNNVNKITVSFSGNSFAGRAILS